MKPVRRNNTVTVYSTKIGQDPTYIRLRQDVRGMVTGKNTPAIDSTKRYRPTFPQHHQEVSQVKKTAFITWKAASMVYLLPGSC